MSLEDSGPSPPSAPIPPEKPRAAVIAELNDRLRVHRTGGRVMMTSGVQALGPVALAAILMKLTAFSDFNRYNDPHRVLTDHGWWTDSNRRPHGYEPCELPDCSTLQ